jgi:hypothetical protein
MGMSMSMSTPWAGRKRLVIDAGRALAGVLTLLAVHGVATAGRPMVTDDAGLDPPGTCDWESFVARVRAPGSSSLQTLSTQVACAVGAQTEVGVALAQDRAAGERAQRLSLGVKQRLWGEADAPTGLVLNLAASGLKTQGSAFKSENTALTLIWTSSPVQDLLLHVNLGGVRHQLNRQSALTWNLASEYSLGQGVDLMAETFGEERSKPWLGTALRWTVKPQFSVDVSWAQQTGPVKTRAISVGCNLGF